MDDKKYAASKFFAPMTQAEANYCLARDKAMRNILHAAFKYDDKPHQLYSALMRAAEFADEDERDEITRLMDQAYRRPSRTALQAALEEYGRHKEGCTWSGKLDEHCSCGFSKRLEQK